MASFPRPPKNTRPSLASLVLSKYEPDSKGASGQIIVSNLEGIAFLTYYYLYWGEGKPAKVEDNSSRLREISGGKGDIKSRVVGNQLKLLTLFENTLGSFHSHVTNFPLIYGPVYPLWHRTCGIGEVVSCFLITEGSL